MPQPFPKESFIYSHKGFPLINNPAHKDDFRYDFKANLWPRRHYVPFYQLRQHNFNEYDEIMHNIQWCDFDLEYQLADPMESNHYIQGRTPFTCFMIALVIILFCVSKTI
jgi:hypothetical protein